jgi:hypothetical protein
MVLPAATRSGDETAGRHRLGLTTSYTFRMTAVPRRNPIASTIVRPDSVAF